MTATGSMVGDARKRHEDDCARCGHPARFHDHRKVRPCNVEVSDADSWLTSGRPHQCACVAYMKPEPPLADLSMEDLRARTDGCTEMTCPHHGLFNRELRERTNK